MMLVYLRFKVDSLMNVPVPVTVVPYRSIAAREDATVYVPLISKVLLLKVSVPSPPKIAPNEFSTLPP